MKYDKSWTKLKYNKVPQTLLKIISIFTFLHWYSDKYLFEHPIDQIDWSIPFKINWTNIN